MSGAQWCARCGHAIDQHQHYRPGTDCGFCKCPQFTRPGVMARVRGWLK